MNQSSISEAVSLLRFYSDIGIEDVQQDQPHNWMQAPQKTVLPLKSAVPDKSAPLHPPQTPVKGAFEAMGEARSLAMGAKTLDELRAALEQFDGLTLKRTATQMVFADGNPDAPLMLVGEAPGADEDRIGRPFVGAAGRLLDKMLAAIGRDRSDTYITNVINWRPPGNRNPSDAEIALCLPFIQRHIELVNPAVLVFVGGVSAKALLETTQGITRLRGKWIDYQAPDMQASIPAVPIFHPAYLLRSPAQKRYAWHDLLSIQARLNNSV